jgi:hypothetical protein
MISDAQLKASYRYLFQMLSEKTWAMTIVRWFVSQVQLKVQQNY